jgi:hypothetical protein
VARTEDVHKSIWSKPDFRRLSPDAKCLYFWTFTCQECNTAGLFEVDLGVIQFATGLSPRRCDAALVELAAGGFAHYEDDVMFVRSRWRHYRTKSPNTIKAVVADLALVKDTHPLKAAFASEYGDDPHLKGPLSELLIPKPFPEGPSKPLQEPSQGLLGKGKGKGITTTTIEDNLFQYWQERCGHPSAKFGTDRRSKVRARLNEGFTEADIRQAIAGAARQPFKKDGKTYDDLELICRSSSKLEDFMARATVRPASGGSQGDRHGKVVQVGGTHGCRRCPKRITNLQANNQSGLCDQCYEAHMARLGGSA